MTHKLGVQYFHNLLMNLASTIVKGATININSKHLCVYVFLGR